MAHKPPAAKWCSRRGHRNFSMNIHPASHLSLHADDWRWREKKCARGVHKTVHKTPKPGGLLDLSLGNCVRDSIGWVRFFFWVITISCVRVAMDGSSSAQHESVQRFPEFESGCAPEAEEMQDNYMWMWRVGRRRRLALDGRRWMFEC